MSTHTPGPWSVYDDFYAEIDGVRIRRLEILALGKTVARIYTSVPEEDTPNARLIGAAPNILAALVLANEAMNYMGDIMNDMDIVEDQDIDKTKPAFEAVMAAIAKATGVE